MPAMHDDVLTAMNKQLEHKRDIMLRTLHFDMTHEECIQLIAPSDHIDILTKAAKYASVWASEQWMQLQVPAAIDGESGQEVQLMMRTHAERSPPLTPRVPCWQPGQSGPKVIDWLTARYALGRRFGVVRQALYVLNRECDSGTQLRYMFPAVMHLCKDGLNPKMDRWITKYGSYKPCRHTPAISPVLKAAIQDSSALLTSMALIGEDVPEPAPGAVLIGLWAMPAFDMSDFGRVNRM